MEKYFTELLHLSKEELIEKVLNQNTVIFKSIAFENSPILISGLLEEE